MTTPLKPLQPETSNSTQLANEQADTYLPWYRSGIVWLGILLTVLVIVGCVHMIIITRDFKIDTPAPSSSKKELTHFRGMPLHSIPSSEATENGKAEE